MSFQRLWAFYGWPTDTIWSRTCFGHLISHLVLISETNSLDDHDNDDDDSADDDDDEDRDNYDALATLSLWTRPILLITSAGCRRLCTGQRHPYYAVMLKLLKLLREKNLSRTCFNPHLPGLLKLTLMKKRETFQGASRACLRPQSAGAPSPPLEPLYCRWMLGGIISINSTEVAKFPPHHKICYRYLQPCSIWSISISFFRLLSVCPSVVNRFTT